MRTKCFAPRVLIAFLLLTLTSCSLIDSIGKPRTPVARRVLFIGNSYTAYNGGIDQQFAGLDPASATARIDSNGYTLQDHWKDGNALKTIHNGKWNYVVLQEQSQTPVLNQRMFSDYAREFDTAIESSGGKTILLMTWERPDSVRQGVTMVNLANVFNTVGKNLGIKVAPAGLAFARSLHTKPDLVLYNQDGHPTIYGTYLAACVIYGTILGTSPVGNSYSDGISSETATFLQRMAAETLGD